MHQSLDSCQKMSDNRILRWVAFVANSEGE